MSIDLKLRASFSYNSQPRAERKSWSEVRRQQLITKLNTRPEIRYAFTVDNPDNDPLIVAVGIRNVATCELAILAADYDVFKLLQLMRNLEGGGK